MPTALPEGYKLDDDPGRIDVDAVHRFVTEAYWAKGRSRDVVAAAIKGSERRRCRWLLQTTGSEALYERFGFTSLTDGRVPWGMRSRISSPPRSCSDEPVGPTS
jgi:hypothetical protein